MWIANQIEIDKLITRKFRNCQAWSVILVFVCLCTLFLCFEFSALTKTRHGNIVIVNAYDKKILTQKPKSLNLSDKLNDYVSASKQLLGSLEEVMDATDLCLGKYIYIQNIPEKYNQELLDHCESITPGTEHNMCPYMENYGFGPEVENSQGVLLNTSWYSTNQFMLGVIFHNKMMTYKCLTNDSSVASAIYIPFYAGLDVSRHLWGVKTWVRDRSAFDLVKLLVKKSEWKTMWGRDHFLVAGRISWDFRRKTDNESDWGSQLMFLPETNNLSMLSFESSSWNNDFAIPYPTCFHPRKVDEVLHWQEKMRKRKRKYLFSFVGASRPDDEDSVRGLIIEECRSSKNMCKLLECVYNEKGKIICDNPISVMRLFQNSVYCLQPTGDSYTRRSIFDAILAGCIPVFFHPATAYAQYKWHLPNNYSKYSVFIPVKGAKDWKFSINQTLFRIGEQRVKSMRDEVIKLIPRILYADSHFRSDIYEDAFDLAVVGILGRIERVRRIMRDGKDPSIGFAEGDHYKFSFDGYLGEPQVKTIVDVL